MERTCPVCGHRMAARDIVCPACRERIEQREPVRREQVLYAWGRGLMLLLAILLFVKAAWATFSPSEYQDFVRALGFEKQSEVFVALNAAFVAAAALLYAVAWLGGYLKLEWEAVVCGLGLAVFVIGQGITQFMFAPDGAGVARPLALFVVWVAVPVFQFAALMLGNAEEEPEPSGGDGS